MLLLLTVPGHHPKQGAQGKRRLLVLELRLPPEGRQSRKTMQTTTMEWWRMKRTSKALAMRRRLVLLKPPRRTAESNGRSFFLCPLPGLVTDLLGVVWYGLPASIGLPSLAAPCFARGHSFEAEV